MTIRDLQKQIADVLNGVEALMQHGCKVFAEDMLTTQDALNNAVATAGRIAVVVVTPRFERDASGCAYGFPAGCGLMVRCIEAPTQRNKRNGFTALDAAEAVAHALDSGSIEWRSIDQSADERRGVVTATAEFGLTIILTEPTERN
ncbi:MAG: hypothetical protein IJJ84_12300 [Kiritimatiellae bacterium]|nr:hypothetical protein [Kiritimatiellia bacterium]